MKVTTINYSKRFPYAPYLNESIGFEATIEEGEDIQEAIQKLREAAEQSFTTAHPTIVLKPLEEQVLSKEEITQSNIKAIMDAKTIEELESYKLMKGQSKDCFHAYNVREKELLKK
jgi:hypothetical protein